MGTNKKTGETEQYWKNKYLLDLKEWGVEMDAETPFADVKEAWTECKKVVSKHEDNTPDVPHLNIKDIPEDDLKALVMKYIKEAIPAQPQTAQGGGQFTEEQLKRLLMSVKEGTTDGKGHVRSGYIEPNDRIETVKFFAPWVRYYVPEKFNGAYAEALPVGIDMLKFVPSFGYSQKIGTMMHRKFVSILEVNSRAVYKYLTGMDLDGTKVGEPHPDFNRMFYINAENAVGGSHNTLWAQTFKKHEFSLASRKHSDLMSMAISYGISTTFEWNSDQYRAAIAEKLTDAEMELLKQQQTENLRSRAAEKLLLKQQDNIDAAVPA